MSSDRNPVRDRVLVLRVLVPSLEARLREKMKEAEEMGASQMASGGGSSATDYITRETLIDLDGVLCEPAEDASTRWNFHCDGATYPARLVNLPCPVEIHKTHDHAMYYKCCDLAQLLVVYEDEMAMEEAESTPGYKQDDYPSYYHSGLTPPMKRVVERRFTAREHKAVPPPRNEVSEIEDELKTMIDRISDSTKTKGKSKAPTLATAQNANKVIEEVVEDVVDYEPWMDDFGRMPDGIEFDGHDPRCTKHPELWLDPKEINEILRIEAEKAEQHEKAVSKKEEKKKKKKAALDTGKPSVKKGIPAKKNQDNIDMVTQAAAAWSQAGDDGIDLMDLDLGDDNFDFVNDGLDMADMAEFM